MSNCVNQLTCLLWFKGIQIYQILIILSIKMNQTQRIMFGSVPKEIR